MTTTKKKPQWKTKREWTSSKQHYGALSFEAQQSDSSRVIHTKGDSYFSSQKLICNQRLHHIQGSLLKKAVAYIIFYWIISTSNEFLFKWGEPKICILPYPPKMAGKLVRKTISSLVSTSPSHDPHLFLIFLSLTQTYTFWTQVEKTFLLRTNHHTFGLASSKAP